jgi:hypothetical protein
MFLVTYCQNPLDRRIVTIRQVFYKHYGIAAVNSYILANVRKLKRIVGLMPGTQGNFTRHLSQVFISVTENDNIIISGATAQIGPWPPLWVS